MKFPDDMSISGLDVRPRTSDATDLVKHMRYVCLVYRPGPEAGIQRTPVTNVKEERLSEVERLLAATPAGPDLVFTFTRSGGVLEPRTGPAEPGHASLVALHVVEAGTVAQTVSFACSLLDRSGDCVEIRPTRPAREDLPGRIPNP